ncbi:MAG: sulfite exporter TauE/SafE family protein, partial [Gammaproteobacteria bacterium]
FILLNSAAGLAGQISKLLASGDLSLLSAYIWLIPAVLIGGQLGSRLGAYHLPDSMVRRLTAVLILYVALRLLLRWHSL